MSEVKMTRIEKYKSLQGAQVAEVIDYLNEHSIHCVSCKEDLVVTELNAPTKNSLSIQLKQPDGTNLYGNPAVTCGSCDYSNTVLKLLYQIVKSD